MDDELMKMMEQAAANAERDGDLFVKRQQLAGYGILMADVLDTQLSVNGWGRMNPRMKALYAELTRLFLERELLG